MKKESLWQSAEDPVSGRTYYYHTETRETQWSKPLELATDEERKAIEEKERQQREFFAAMEANIMNSIAVGNFAQTNQEIVVPTLRHDSGSRPPKDNSRRSQMIRTISSMEDSVLVDLVCRVPSTRNVFRSAEPRDDTKEIVFQPQDAEKTPTTTRKLPPSQNLPTMEPVARNITVVPSLSLLEATKRSTRSLLMDSKLSSKNSLNAIDEFDSLNGSAMQLDLHDCGDLDIEDHGDDDKGERHTLNREASLGTLLRQLPKEGVKSMRSLYGASSFDESKLSFRLTFEETKALEELAMVSEEMAKIGNEGVHDFDADFTSNRDMMLLRDIHEGSQSEDETDSEREEKDGGANPEGVRRLPPLMDVGGGTPWHDADKGNDLLRRENSMRLKERNRHQSSYKNLLSKPSFERRNTCGNLYVGSTMSTPDSDATLKCICGVYRAHILNSEKDGDEDGQDYPIFNDLESQQKRSQHKRAFKKGFSAPVFVVKPPPPALEEITAFFRDVFYASKMESDCMIISLIYVERLIKTTEGKLRPRTSNWRSILFSCMVLASKVWDDLSMWNVDFSETCPTGVEFSLQRINELEIALLATLDYQVKVPAGEYAKYYFLLRSMLIKSGLGGEKMKASDPLDIEGAKRLQHMSSLFQHKATSRRDLMTSISSKNFEQTANRSGTAKGKVQLEHVVRM